MALDQSEYLSMLFVEANGARIPAIGLGTWELRGRTCARLVEQAMRLGYRHIDTAQVYENEREVGEGLRASRIRRDDVFVTTKVWTNHFRAARSRAIHQGEPDQAAADRSRSVACCTGPIRRCRWRRRWARWRMFKELGMARHIGVSNFTVALIDEAVAACPEPLVCDQVEYHPYLDQIKVREACARHGMALVAYSPVARGRIKNDATLARIGRVHGKTTAQICLRWLVQQNVSAIPRTSRIERLSENIDIFDFALSEEEMAEIFRMGSAKARLTDFGFAPKWD